MKRQKKMPRFSMVQAKKGTFGRLLGILFKNSGGALAVVAVCIVAGALAGIAATVFLQRLIDECIVPGLEKGMSAVYANLIAVALQMGSVYLFGTVCTFVQARIRAVVTQKTLDTLRTDMFNKMQGLPVKYFDTHAHGDIMSCYTNDTDAVRELVGHGIPQFFSAALSAVMIFGTMLSYSVWLTLVVIACLVAMLSVTGKIGGASARHMIAQQRALGRAEGFIEEMMNGQKVVKVFRHERASERDFDALNEQLFQDASKAHTYANVLMPVLGNIGYLMYVLVALIGGLLAYFRWQNVSLTGIAIISPGIIISFLAMSRQLSQTVGMIAQGVGMITMGLAGVSRVFALLDEPAEQNEGYVKLVNVREDENGALVPTQERTQRWAWEHYHKTDGSTTYTPLNGDIVLQDVDFAYVEGKPVLRNISLHALPGQKVALVGATGAGKTTITNLLNRFYDIEDGKIRYDGINVNKIDKKDLRRSLGIVLQDTNLFTGTVMDNIRYGRPEADDEQCIAAAKLANAHGFITRLPQGYGTLLTNNGANLSQGQRQLLSIARAAAADAPVMILDEATSSIDTRTEALVQDGMDKLMRGRTVFVIAHRLSTVRNSDVILVLDHGQIVERGTHEQLIAAGGMYSRLYTGAFELE